VISPGTVAGSERLRLFLGFRLTDGDLDELVTWQARELRAGGTVRVVPRENLHVTLAFLGSRPAAEVGGITAALETSVGNARARGHMELRPERYRETRSVAMVVLADAKGRASALAGDLHARLEALGVYRREQRPWLPHLTVLRFRERPRLSPPLPAVGPLVPSDAAVFLSRLHPSGARYEVLESFRLGG
jgi:2'-5' RNA ligase